MSDSNDFQLSIQLEENGQHKSKEQELQEFVELTRKIAQSDRNNEMLRQVRRNKHGQLQKIKSAYRQIVQDRECSQNQYERVNQSLKQARALSQSNSEMYENLAKKSQENALRERQIENKNILILKENQKLEKNIASLQTQYEAIIKQNKRKQAQLLQFRKVKDEQNEIFQQNENKIFQLQRKCESTKRKAELLQIDLKKQLELAEQLKMLANEKERQLQNQKKEREDNCRKQEESKRSVAKIMAQAKQLQEQIDRKLAEIHRLQGVHSKLQKQIEKMESSQRAYEQAVQRRRQVINAMKKSSSKVKKQRQIHEEEMKRSS